MSEDPFLLHLLDTCGKTDSNLLGYGDTVFFKYFFIFFNKFSFKKSGLSCDLIQTEFC